MISFSLIIMDILHKFPKYSQTERRDYWNNAGSPTFDDLRLNKIKKKQILDPNCLCYDAEFPFIQQILDSGR